MAGEQHGPAAHNMLEPPGFMALNYGIRTPLSVLLSHIVFGAILGAFYQYADLTPHWDKPPYSAMRFPPGVNRAACVGPQPVHRSE